MAMTSFLNLDCSNYLFTALIIAKTITFY